MQPTDAPPTAYPLFVMVRSMWLPANHLLNTTLLFSSVAAPIIVWHATPSVNLLFGALLSAFVGWLLEYILLKGARSYEEQQHTFSAEVIEDRSVSPLMAISVPAAGGAGVLWLAYAAFMAMVR